MNFQSFTVNFLLAIVLLHSSLSEVPPGKKVLLSLPQNERSDFVAYSLGESYTKKTSHIHRMADIRFPDGLGISEELIDKFQKLNVPANFTANLYVWVKARFNMTEVDLRHLILYRKVCLSNGVCIDIDDIGGLCCPF